MQKVSTFSIFPKFVALAAFLLIFAGGLVTSTGSGLSVPDWPLSFGTLFPRMRCGVVFEHTHRIIAGVVILLTLILVLRIFREKKPKLLKILALSALGMIFVQAILGGITVLLKLPLLVSAAHAGVAQLFFCLIATLALLTSEVWEETSILFEDTFLCRLTFLTTAVIYFQILLGAVMRHLGAGLAIPDFPLSFGYLIPPASTFTFPVAVNYAHRAGAVLITVLEFLIFFRIFKNPDVPEGLKKFSFASIGILSVQILLGFLIIRTGRAVIPTTAHVAIGGLLLVTNLSLTLLAWKGRAGIAI